MSNSLGCQMFGSHVPACKAEENSMMKSCWFFAALAILVSLQNTVLRTDMTFTEMGTIQGNQNSKLWRLYHTEHL